MSTVGLVDEGKGAAAGVRVRVSWPGLKCSHILPCVHLASLRAEERHPQGGVVRVHCG